MGSNHGEGPSEQDRGSKGVFLSPLSPGRHTITIRGGAFGDLVEETLGITHLREDFTST